MQKHPLEELFIWIEKETTNTINLLIDHQSIV